MQFVVTWQGQDLRTDDLTLDEVEAAEAVSGVPWSILNPFASIGAARALLGLLLVRQGATDVEAREAVDALRVKDIKSIFRKEDDDPKEPRTTGSSGGSPGAAGRRTSPAGKSSET